MYFHYFQTLTFNGMECTISIVWISVIRPSSINLLCIVCHNISYHFIARLNLIHFLVLLRYHHPNFLLFQNVRPSAENLPEDLALIVTSCWIEDPNARPNFSQIIQMLLHYLSTISPPAPVIPPRIYASENTVFPPESPGTSSLMAARHDSGETPTSNLEDKSVGFFSCFRQCYWSQIIISPAQ
jgi:hypothetical protein